MSTVRYRSFGGHLNFSEYVWFNKYRLQNLFSTLRCVLIIYTFSVTRAGKHLLWLCSVSPFLMKNTRVLSFCNRMMKLPYIFGWTTELHAHHSPIVTLLSIWVFFGELAEENSSLTLICFLMPTKLIWNCVMIEMIWISYLAWTGIYSGSCIAICVYQTCPLSWSLLLDWLFYSSYSNKHMSGRWFWTNRFTITYGCKLTVYINVHRVTNRRGLLPH